MEFDIEKILDRIFARAAGDPSLTWATGATMPAEAFQDFIRTTEDTSALLRDMQAAGTLVTFGGDTYKIPLLGFADRQLQKATVNVEPTTIPTFSNGKAEIDPTEVILPVNIPYSALEDAVGKTPGEVGSAAGNAKLDQAIGDLAMGAVANDLEDLVLNGDTASGTPFLQTFDGAIKLVAAGGTYYNPGAAQTVMEFLRGMYDTASARIRRDRTKAFYVSALMLSELWEAYGNRGTPLGDNALTTDQSGSLRFRGIAVKELVRMPDAKAFLGTANAWWAGFKRTLTVERQRNPRRRQIEYTLTARVGHVEVLNNMVLGNWTT